MAPKGSSSKRKSSKRKSSKISSEARRRKRSRKTKSKKLRRDDHSDSSYSDDDSRSPVSSFSSEDDSRRGRSRKRSDAKSGKKRRRRSYSSSESSEDDRLKKRKLSKKNRGSVVRKKTKKKKLKRKARVSSMSSDSRSCSSCQSGSVEYSGDRDFETSRGRSREKEDEKNSAKSKRGARSSKRRSPSCSSCSINGDSNREDLADEYDNYNSRRLRSIVTIPNRPDEDENVRDNDRQKEEIVYDHDDYPCRSNDSNDCISKRQLADGLHFTSLGKRVESANGNETLSSIVKTAEQGESGEDCFGLDDRSNPHFVVGGTSNLGVENATVFSGTIATSGSEDLESILRQKALENLKKFKGASQKNPNPSTDQTSRTDSDGKQSFPAEDEFNKKNLPKDDDCSGVGATQVVARRFSAISRRDVSHPTINYGNSIEEKQFGPESGTVRKRVVGPSDQTTLSSISQEKNLAPIGAVTSKPKSGSLSLKQESSSIYSTLEKEPVLQASPRSKLVVAESGVNSDAFDSSQTLVGTSNTIGAEVTNGESAALEDSARLESSLEEGKLEEQKDDTKDSSQFEKKTMSVMRGGEMVQVSYKVYIPKNARALGRRQLRR